MPRLTYSNFSLMLYALAALVFAAGCTPTRTPAPAPTDTPAAGIPAALLEAPDTSGNVWIEFPYEGQILPNEPLTFVVYAASAGGVEGIGLSVNDAVLMGGTLADHSTDGDGSLMSIEQTWQPPAPGKYVLAASSVGASSAVEFCIEYCDTPVLEELPTGSPTPTPWISATPTAYQPGTPTPTAYIQPDTPTPTAYVEETYMDFGADPTEMGAGSCTTLYWTTEGYTSVTLNGNGVTASGTDEECLCETNTYTLTGTTAGGVVESETVTVSVTGSCEVADTTPPEISWTDIRWDDCKFYGSAQISDDSGTVSWAKFYYNLNGGGWNSVWMQDLGGGVWESEVGISVSDGMSTPVGSFLYQVETADEAGNTLLYEGTEQGYNSCSG